MVTLTIQAIEYGLPVTTLNRIGEMALYAFDGIFDDLAIQTSGQMVINHPVNPKILLRCISSNEGEYTVGVVGSDLVSGTGRDEWQFEVAYGGKPGVVVSTYRLDPASYEQPNLELLTRRTAIQAIHGLGHNFSLNHHEPRKTRNGYLCPMGRKDMDSWRDYLFEVIDQRGLSLCNPCYNSVVVI